MVFACGLSHYDVGVFHLVNHAFFKALLFLGPAPHGRRPAPLPPDLQRHAAGFPGPGGFPLPGGLLLQGRHPGGGLRAVQPPRELRLRARGDLRGMHGLLLAPPVGVGLRCGSARVAHHLPGPARGPLAHGAPPGALGRRQPHFGLPRQGHDAGCRHRLLAPSPVPGPRARCSAGGGVPPARVEASALGLHAEWGRLGGGPARELGRFPSAQGPSSRPARSVRLFEPALVGGSRVQRLPGAGGHGLRAPGHLPHPGPRGAGPVGPLGADPHLSGRVPTSRGVADGLRVPLRPDPASGAYGASGLGGRARLSRPLGGSAVVPSVGRGLFAVPRGVPRRVSFFPPASGRLPAVPRGCTARSRNSGDGRTPSPLAVSIGARGAPGTASRKENPHVHASVELSRPALGGRLGVVPAPSGARHGARVLAARSALDRRGRWPLPALRGAHHLSAALLHPRGVDFAGSSAEGVSGRLSGPRILHVGGLRHPRFAGVLPLLRGGVAAHVPDHRSVRFSRAQGASRLPVLPLHPAGFRPAAAGHSAAVPADGHDGPPGAAADLLQRAPSSAAVGRLLRVLRRQSAHGARAHLVARGARGSPHGGFRDFGRGAVEAGHLRVPPLLHSPASSGHPVLHALGVHPERGGHPVHIPHDPAPGGSEEDHRLLLRGPHELRHAGPLQSQPAGRRR
eukprot:scaffold3008_cov1771-Pavlova_lutheri.AAC.7